MKKESFCEVNNFIIKGDKMGTFDEKKFKTDLIKKLAEEVDGIGHTRAEEIITHKDVAPHLKTFGTFDDLHAHIQAMGTDKFSASTKTALDEYYKKAVKATERTAKKEEEIEETEEEESKRLSDMKEEDLTIEKKERLEELKGLKQREKIEKEESLWERHQRLKKLHETAHFHEDPGERVKAKEELDKYKGNRFSSGFAHIATHYDAIKISGAWWLLFAFLLFLLDLFTGFSGYNLEFLWNATVYEKAIRGPIGAFVILYLIFYIFSWIFGGRTNIRGFIIRIIVLLLFSALSVASGNIGTTFHLVFALLYWQMVLLRFNENKEEDKASADLTLIEVMLFDFFIIDGFANLTRIPLDDRSKALITAVSILPVWFFYIAIWEKRRLEMPWWRTAIVFITAAILIFSVAAESMDFVYADAPEINRFKELKDKAIKAPQNAGKYLTNQITRQLEFATGGYYEGQVEKQENEPLGVYIKDIEAADKEFYEDERISVWATLEAKTLDNEQPVNVVLSCEAYESDEEDDKKGEGIEGTVTPDYFKEEEKNFMIDALEEEDIKCEFEPDSLKEGTQKIKIFAGFNFLTKAYLKTYFVTNDRLRAMRREEIDVFDFYRIKDKNPVAKFTNGPVKLGIETKEPPIGISSEYDTKPMIGVMLDINPGWKGKIKEIKELILYIPDSMELDTDSCDPSGTFGISDESEYEGYSAYKLQDWVKKKKELIDIEEPKSFRCRLNIAADKVSKVLGDSPFATKYFRVSADYIFETEKSASVTVRESKDFNVHFSPTTATSSEKEIVCIGKHPEKNIKNATYLFYKKDAYKDYELVKEGTITCSAKECKVSYFTDSYPVKKDDTIKCVMEAKLKTKDGAEEIETDLTIIEIKNSLPKIEKIAFEPEKAEPTASLKCIGNFSDKDNDVVTATYKFEEGYFDADNAVCEKENNMYKCITKEIPAEELSTGETIRCTITPHDGEENGIAAVKEIVVS